MEQINLAFSELPYAVEEALNRLRINVKFCGKNTKVILVVSSVPNEGKSFVSAHLWKMLAEAGFPSVLVDTDLRKSVLKSRHSFEQQEEKEIQGITYYLSGQAEYEDILYHTNIPNGDIVPCTNLLENPSALLEDPRMKELFERLSQDYRYVIVDAPPLINVSDGVLLASMADGVLLVVNSKETSRTLVKESLQQLERSGCRLLGMVLNKVEGAGRGKYKYYGKYGRYGKYGQYYSYYGSDEKD